MTAFNITGPVDDGGDDRHESGPTGQHEEQGQASDAAHSARRQSRNQAGRQGKQRPHPQNERLPTRQEILLSIKNLASLVAAKVINPSEHNAMLASLKTLLANLGDGSPQAGLLDGATPSLREAIRKSPDLLNVLAHLLTDEQLRELADDDDPSPSDEGSSHERG